LKTVVGKESSCRATLRELTELRTRLSEAEETLCAIRRGKVDAVMVSGIEVRKCSRWKAPSERTAC